MKRTTKQDKLLRLGRKRQGFGTVFLEKFIPIIAVGTAVCILSALILHELAIAMFHESDLSYFHMVVNSANQDLTEIEKEKSDNKSERYMNAIALAIYTASGDGDSSAAFRLYKNDKEVLRTERNGVAFIKGEKDCICYSDTENFAEAYSRLEKYPVKKRLFGADTYLTVTDTIYADTEKGIFFPGEMHIEHYSYDRFGQPPVTETVEQFDLTPADTTGLTKYVYGQFVCGAVMGADPDDEIFRILDEKDAEAGAAGSVSRSASTSVFWDDTGFAYGWVRSNIHAPDGTLYTVTSVQKTNITPLCVIILSAICVAVLVICLVMSLIMAHRTYTVYKAHYAMEDYRRDMTNTLAHDLKTPLMAVSGCAEMLSDNTDAEKQKKYTDMILLNVDYMNAMITNVLELSRLEGGAELGRTSFDAAEAAKEVARKNSSVAEEKNIRLTVRGSGTINADRQLMIQAMDNLVSNALKFSPEGSETVIEVSDRAMVISNPVNMPVTDPDRLWQPFVKGDDARNGQNGTGLGLYIVKTICDRHGFDCSIDTQNDRFAVRIGF